MKISLSVFGSSRTGLPDQFYKEDQIEDLKKPNVKR